MIQGLCGQNPPPTPSQFSAAIKTCLINSLVSNSNATNCEVDSTQFVMGFLESFVIHAEHVVYKDVDSSQVLVNVLPVVVLCYLLQNIHGNKFLRTKGSFVWTIILENNLF